MYNIKNIKFPLFCYKKINIQFSFNMYIYNKISVFQNMLFFFMNTLADLFK